MKLLVVNVGSTSLKFRLFDLAKGEAESASGRLEGIGSGASQYRMAAASGKREEGQADWPDYAPALEAMMAFLTEGGEAPLKSLEDLDGVRA